MAIQLDYQFYRLTDNMIITWSIPNVSVSSPIGIWLFETNATYPTSSPLYTSNKWPLVYNTNPSLTRYTVNLGQLLKSYPDGVLLSEGPFYTVIAFDALGNRLAALPTTFSIGIIPVNTNLSLEKVLLGGNYATTDIDMKNNAVVSSGSILHLGDTNTDNVSIMSGASPGFVNINAIGAIGVVSINGNTCNIGNDETSSVKYTNQINLCPGLDDASVTIAPDGIINIGNATNTSGNVTTALNLYCPILPKFSYTDLINGTLSNAIGTTLRGTMSSPPPSFSPSIITFIISQITIPYEGIYSINATISFNTTLNVSANYFSFYIPGVPLATEYNTIIFTRNKFVVSLSGTFHLTAAQILSFQTYLFLTNPSDTAPTIITNSIDNGLDNFNFTAIRIA